MVHLEERLERARVGALQVRDAAVRAHLAREPHAELRVGAEARVALVLLDERPLAGRERDAVEVVEALVAVVQADQDLAGEVGARLLDARLDARERRQVLHGERHEVERVDAPVLVAVLVLQVDEVAVVVGPEVLRDAALRVVRDRAGRREVADRRDPQVHERRPRARATRSPCRRGSAARPRGRGCRRARPAG